MLNKKSLSIFMLFVILFVSTFGIITVSADNSWPVVEEANKKTAVNFKDEGSNGLLKQKEENFVPTYKDPYPEITVDDATSWGYRKGFQIIRFLQVIAQPIMIIVFIFSLFKLLLGVFSRGDSFKNGLIGMILSGVAYVGILYAPAIMDAMRVFFSS